TNVDEREQTPGNPRYRRVYTAAAGLRPEPAASVDAARRAARHRQLHAAVGEIDGGGGQGGASRVLPAGQPDTGAVPERKAKRRVDAQGGRVREPDGNQGPGRRHKRNLDRFSEPVADCITLRTVRRRARRIFFMRRRW